jgi:hypothetical protein
MAGKCDECGGRPCGASGHSGLGPVVATLDQRTNAKRYLLLVCSRCGTQWVRGRISSEVFEWFPVAGAPKRKRGTRHAEKLRLAYRLKSGA